MVTAAGVGGGCVLGNGSPVGSVGEGVLEGGSVGEGVAWGVVLGSAAGVGAVSGLTVAEGSGSGRAVGPFDAVESLAVSGVEEALAGGVGTGSD